MNNKLIEYEGAKYYIDTDVLFNYIFTPTKDNDDFTKSINQVYDTDNTTEKLEISQKQIVETTESNNELNTNLRYDFLVVRALGSLMMDVDGCDFDVDEPTFMQSVYFNTLIKAGILVKIEE